MDATLHNQERATQILSDGTIGGIHKSLYQIEIIIYRDLENYCLNFESD